MRRIPSVIAVILLVAAAAFDHERPTFRPMANSRNGGRGPGGLDRVRDPVR
jgi:hypothetical protein